MTRRNGRASETAMPARRMIRSSHAPTPGHWLSLAASLFVLNFALTFHNIWPTLWITTRHELSIEIAVLVLALAAYASLYRPPSPRFMTALALVLLVYAIGRYAEVTAPALYGRPINLYWDAPHALNVVTMLGVAASPLTVVLTFVCAIALAGVSFILLRWSLGRVRAGLELAASRRVLAALSAGIVLLYAIGHTSAPLRTLRWFSLPVTATYWHQTRFTLDAYRRANDNAGSMCAPAGERRDLARLAGTDVLIVFLESYGATSYDRPDIAAALQRSRSALAEAAAETGRGVVSAFVQSPTFGGASWLAHSTFLTGRPVRDNGSYNLLLTQDCDAVTKQFASNGYRVVSLMPGLKRDWPEGAFYGFDAIYGERELEYRGPEFGWWRIPDQYALAKLDEAELRATARSPVFVFFPTISSHMPFRPTPPYQPRWPRVLGDRPYDDEQVARSLAIAPDWMNLAPDYAAAIAYTFDYVGGYLRERPDLDLLLVLVGDHQPPATVAGEGVRWDVPVHVVASRAELLEPLLDAGFMQGLRPATAPVASMHELAALLFGDAGRTASIASAGGSRVDVAGAGVRRQTGDDFLDSTRVDPGL